MSTASDLKDQFVQAMSCIPSPVAIITSGAEGARLGMTVSAITSLSADPPSILICVNKSASAHDSLIAASGFSANIIAQDQAEIAGHFSKKDVDRFALGDWQQSDIGTPLLNQAATSLACRIAKVYDGYSHSIIIGDVVSVACGTDRPAGRGVVWLDRQFRSVE